MAKILVTGGAGYIGSHCCKALAEAGHEPVVFDSLSTGHRDFVRWGPLVEADIRDQSALFDAMETHCPVAVMHFASLISVGESVSNPERYYDVNVGGTLALLKVMQHGKINRLVFSSTAAVYGPAVDGLIKEDAPLAPASPYGNSKLMCEQMMADVATGHGLQSMRLRYFNAAGADVDGLVGEHHEPETHLIPLVLDAALGRRDSIRIFGTDYPTADGTAIRDYIHVTDLARGHVKALDYLLDGGTGMALNLGTGEGVSVRQVIETVFQVVGKPILIEEAPRRAGDCAALVADPAQAFEMLSWKANYSDLKTIVSDAWRWHQKRFS